MKLAVTDANIFIDLIKLQMLDHLFGIGVEIHTSREVVDQLNDSQSSLLAIFIKQGKLFIYDFSAAENNQIRLMPAPRALDHTDKTVVYLALKIKATVLTGDGPLRNCCTGHKLTVRGIIWLFDAFLDKQLILHGHAIAKMELLLSFNDRLPKDECFNRMKQWKEKQ